ncbi:MAG: KH domain-containing protein [Nitrososphaerota archaeon]
MTRVVKIKEIDWKERGLTWGYITSVWEEGYHEYKEKFRTALTNTDHRGATISNGGHVFDNDYKMEFIRRWLVGLETLSIPLEDEWRDEFMKWLDAGWEIVFPALGFLSFKKGKVKDDAQFFVLDGKPTIKLGWFKTGFLTFEKAEELVLEKQRKGDKFVESIIKDAEKNGGWLVYGHWSDIEPSYYALNGVVTHIPGSQWEGVFSSCAGSLSCVKEGGNLKPKVLALRLRGGGILWIILRDTITVPTKYAGLVIGRGGKTIKWISEIVGRKVKVLVKN